MPKTNEASKKLTTRVTKQQKVKLLQLLKGNKSVGRGLHTSRCSGIQHDRCWKNIALELNSMDGSHKSPGQWKRCWIDWKAAVKRQYAQIKAFKAKTKYRPLSERPKPLGKVDAELIQFFSSTDIVERYEPTSVADFKEEMPFVIVDVQPSTSHAYFGETRIPSAVKDEPVTPGADVNEPITLGANIDEPVISDANTFEPVSTIVDTETEASSRRAQASSSFRKHSCFEKVKIFATEQNSLLLEELKKLNENVFRILKEMKEINEKLK